MMHSIIFANYALIITRPTLVDLTAVRHSIRERVEAQIAVALRKRSYRPGTQQGAAILEGLTRWILGLGFLDLLLPPARTDISEISLYSSGLLQIMPKGSGVGKPLTCIRRQARSGGWSPSQMSPRI
jgi:hypothetical protein